MVTDRDLPALVVCALVVIAVLAGYDLTTVAGLGLVAVALAVLA